MDKIITAYMMQFCPAREIKQSVPGELTFDLLESLADQEHAPIKFKVNDSADPVYAEEELLGSRREGGYVLPEMHGVWQQYLTHRDDIDCRETAYLQEEMILIISRQLLAGVGVSPIDSFRSFDDASRYYMEQLADLPGSEAAELKDALKKFQ